MARSVVRQDKDADATLDYLFDWSAQMDADGDTIVSATVSAPAGIGLGSASVTASTIQVYVSGGAEGTTYALVNHVWTSGGRQDDKVLELTITQQPSASHGLVVETGLGSGSANAYAGIADGDAYHAGHLYAATWIQATDSAKGKALIWASRLLDEWIAWDGIKATRDQALQWPRHGARDRGGYVIDSNRIPAELVDASAELARHLLAEDRTAFDEEAPRGFRRIKAGSLEIEVDRGDRKRVLPAVVTAMLRPLGRPQSVGVVSLSRA